MTMIRFTLKACLAILIGTLPASIAQAQIVFDDSFNFREFRVNPPLNYQQGDLLRLGIDVIDTTTGVAPAGALVGAENSATGEKFFMRVDGPVEYFRSIPYTPARAVGDWIIGVTSDVVSETSLIPSFGTGPGTDAILGVANLTVVPGAQPMFSWNLPAGLPTLNDGNINRIRVRINDSNGLQILNATVDDATLTAESYTVNPGMITNNGAFVGQVLIEGFTPFNRSRTFQTFVVNNVGTGGQDVTGDPFFFRDNRRANSVRFGEGDLLVVGINAFPSNNTFVYAENSGVIVPLSQAREANRQFEFASSFAYDAGLTDAWNIVAWNGAVDSPTPTHVVGSVALLDFVDNIRMLPNFLEPTLEWDLPTGATFDNVQIGLFDDVTDDRLSVFGPGQNELFETLPVNATSYTFAPGALQAGQKYVVRILLRDVDVNGFEVNRSLTFFNFSPIMMTSTVPVYLPSLSPGGVYNFDFDVTAGFPVTIDPHAAIGYEYAIGVGNPRFATVTLPSVGDDQYDLILFDEMDNPLPAISLIAHETFDLATVDPSGVARFRVLGIEESTALDPNDATAFMTTVTFNGDGQFTGTMTPITESESTIFNLVESLQENVQALVDAQKLKKSKGKKLVKNLDKALKAVTKERVDKACKQLDTFIKRVDKLIDRGKLDAQEGNPLPLIAQAEIIKSIVDCSVVSDDGDADSDHGDSDDD